MARSPPVWSGSSLKRVLFAVLATAALGSCALRPSHDRHFLWVLSGEHNHVYLMGSFHLLRSSDYPLAPEFEAAYRDALQDARQ